MRQSGPGPKNKNTDRCLRYFAYLTLAAVVGCVIARAPTSFNRFTVPVIKVELSLNAGYVLVAGPFLIVAAIAVIMYMTRGKHLQDKHGAGLAHVAVRVLPCLAATFLSLQFFLLLAPKGQCPSFSPWRYLTDPTLAAFQPEYCMGVSAEVQERMPWLLNPPVLQGWLQVLLPLVAFGLIAVDLRRHRKPRV